MTSSRGSRESPDRTLRTAIIVFAVIEAIGLAFLILYLTNR